MNVTAPIRDLARAQPDATALIGSDDGALSYAALERAIDGMAARALALGLAPGDVVGLTLGGAEETLALILGLALARVGIASANPAPAPPRLRTTLVPDAAWRAAAVEAAAIALHPDDGALLRIFSSSGTTGESKHVPIGHALMARRVRANALAAGDAAAGARTVRLVAVGLGVAWGFVAVLRTLWAGGTLVLGNAQTAATRIPHHRVTSLLIAPAGLRRLLDALAPDEGPFPTLAQVEIGGSRLAAPLRAAAAARLSPGLYSSFGTTEAGNVAFAPFAALAARPGAVGIVDPAAGVETVDARDMKLPAGQEGRLRIRSALLADGYLRPDGVLEPFRDGWFDPGDVGAVWPDGMLTLAGRTTEISVPGGARIDAPAIEDALLALPEVAEVVAFGLPDAAGTMQIWAAIVPRTPITPAALAALCRAALPATPPRFIMQMRALPCAANGKVRTDLLIAQARRWQSTAATAAPRSPASGR